MIGWRSATARSSAPRALAIAARDRARPPRAARGPDRPDAPASGAAARRRRSARSRRRAHAPATSARERAAPGVSRADPLIAASVRDARPRDQRALSRAARSGRFARVSRGPSARPLRRRCAARSERSSRSRLARSRVLQRRRAAARRRARAPPPRARRTARSGCSPRARSACSSTPSGSPRCVADAGRSARRICSCRSTAAAARGTTARSPTRRPTARARDAGGRRSARAAARARPRRGPARARLGERALARRRTRRRRSCAQLGRDAVLVDRRGRSLLDYPGLRRARRPIAPTTAWARPASTSIPRAPGVAERLVATFGELVTRYPALDGLHLDYIRYPDVLPFSPGTRFGVGLDFGYGAASRARFAQRDRAARAVRRLARERRRAGTTGAASACRALVRAIARAARAQRPGIAISAAVWSHADRAYLAISQDWRALARGGLARLRRADGLHARRPRCCATRPRTSPACRSRDRIWVGPRHAGCSRAIRSARSRRSSSCSDAGAARRRALLVGLDRASRADLRCALAPRGRAGEPAASTSTTTTSRCRPSGSRRSRRPSATPRACCVLDARERRARAPTRSATCPRCSRPGDLLVVNATRVLPARLRGAAPSGGAAEALLLGPGSAPGPLPRARAHARAPARRARSCAFAAAAQALDAELVALAGDGEVRARVRAGRVARTRSARRRCRPTSAATRRAPEDAQRYQTVFARVPGAVAAPTAGLHLSRGAARGARRRAAIARAEVVLHVGPRHLPPLRRGGARARAACTPSASSCPTRPRDAIARDARARRRAWWRSARPPRACSRACARRATATSRRGAGETDLFLAPGRPLPRRRRAAHQLPPAALVAAAARRRLRGPRAPCSRPTPRRSRAAIASTPTATRC